MTELSELPSWRAACGGCTKGPLFVLPNAWDAASARVLADAGFPAVASASAAVAASRGYPDNDSMSVHDAFDAVATIAEAVACPVSADVEAGYGLEPAELVERLLESGAVGLNLEDTDHHGKPPAPRRRGAGRSTSREIKRHRTRVRCGSRGERPRGRVRARGRVARVPPGGGRAARAALPQRPGPTASTRSGSQSDATIQMLVAELGAPVNVLVRPGTPSLARLAELDVARVTFGPGLQRVAMAALARFAEGCPPTRTSRSSASSPAPERRRIAHARLGDLDDRRRRAGRGRDRHASRSSSGRSPSRRW